MSEKGNEEIDIDSLNPDSDFRVKPPDFSGQNGPGAWIGRKFQEAFGIKPEVGTRSAAPSTPSPKSTEGK